MDYTDWHNIRRQAEHRALSHAFSKGQRCEREVETANMAAEISNGLFFQACLRLRG